jgi:hypothetical protein
MRRTYSKHRNDEKFKQNFSQKTLREIQLGRYRHISEDNIKMHLKETGCEGVDWIQVVHDRDQWQTLVNSYESSGYIKHRDFFTS